MKSDIQIAQSIKPKPIKSIAEKLGIDQKDLILYGENKAKINIDAGRCNTQTVISSNI